jgi:hypothetical protein
MICAQLHKIYIFGEVMHVLDRYLATRFGQPTSIIFYPIHAKSVIERFANEYWYTWAKSEWDDEEKKYAMGTYWHLLSIAGLIR